MPESAVRKGGKAGTLLFVFRQAKAGALEMKKKRGGQGRGKCGATNIVREGENPVIDNPSRLGGPASGFHWTNKGKISRKEGRGAKSQM